MLPTVSIVGRPNVGKSTIFNRLVGERQAIVHDEYGVTRDRHYGDSYWNGVDFNIIDTGGYLPDELDTITVGVREQVLIAIEESDVILFVVDAKTGINMLDESVAQILRRQIKPVLLVANKADNEGRRLEASEFYSLGFDDLYSISAISGTGTGELMDRIIELLPDHEPEQQENIPKLAFIGRPNVGKSSLVNALVDDERCIVTDIAGTTRDTINTYLSFNDKEYTLMDTAGLRKRVKVKENIEFYSTVRTEKAIRECDVAVLILDAERGFDAQDKRVLRQAEEYNKGLIIVWNKWDLIDDKDTHTVREFEKVVYEAVPQMDYIPILTISATNKKRIHKVLELCDEVIEERKKQISTSELNDFIEKTLHKRPLPMKRGRELKIQYGSQVKANPPVFKFFMNSPQDLPANYRRYLENQIRETYKFTGVPITMVFKQK
ncbi:MAG: ribosome biogenesis GTPase Der [Bacteroidetes bacterium TMED284]|jgi:GTP-binding protein|nr:ribosome biogenesis GTPase Der [Balneola sp.]OUX47651.1 MAG: ribosome biogenesis GTPase Der [Bacteroidetes bacterium TMED284]CAI8302178.1 MAG: GTPase Der [Rhodothermaeota bacterium MED-G12]|tara:strand:- start:9082 stop:10389 length:1308 start_codon:yes stop_codon:yes gene_type:complete